MRPRKGMRIAPSLNRKLLWTITAVQFRKSVHWDTRGASYKLKKSCFHFIIESANRLKLKKESNLIRPSKQ